VRLAQVTKAEGIEVPEGRSRLVAFSISEVCHVFELPPYFWYPSSNTVQTGLTPLTLPTLPTAHLLAPLITSSTITPTLPQKRKLSATYLEIPDSEGEDDEDYGWAEEDEEDVPPPPPQWQGSEDILVPADGELEPEEEDPELNFEDEGEAVSEESHEERVEIVDSEDELALWAMKSTNQQSRFSFKF